MRRLMYGFADGSILHLSGKSTLLFAAAAVILPLSGCGAKPGQAVEPEVSVHYQADYGEYKPEGSISVPKEDIDSAREKGKTIVTFYDCAGGKSMYQDLVTAFNNENEQYFVELTVAKTSAEWEAMRTRTKLEVGSGGGPDLMTDQSFSVSQEMLEKGILVDLAPYLQASGMTADKYFPGYARLTSGDSIFSLAPNHINTALMSIDEKVLDGDPAPDIETLVDKLLAYPEKAAFIYQGENGGHILDYFLCGSEDLWGMVDWENRKCDFTGELFSKMLKTAKRYSEDGQGSYEAVMYYEDAIPGFYKGPERLAAEGRVLINTYFDDGCYPKYPISASAVMINANTEKLDGAWAFVSFVMSMQGMNYSTYPVNREAWMEKMEFDLALIKAGRSTSELKPEQIDELIEIYESARFLPTRTEGILSIVEEEAEGYFSGQKSEGEVIDIIQNRVQLYLSEE